MDPNPPHRHHFIPEFYQRKWAGPDGKVERYEKINGSVVRRRVAPKAAGFRENLYRHPRPEMDEWTAQFLEWGIFQAIDTAGATALDALLTDAEAIRSAQVRHDWALFLRAMLMRTPSQMSATLASLEKIWSEVDVSEKYAAMRHEWMPEKADELLRLLNPNIAEESAFQLFASNVWSDKLIHHIANLPWRILEFAEAKFDILLSDHPVVLVPLQTTNGHIAMPLSPTKLLVASSQIHVQRQMSVLGGNAAVRALNRLTVTRAQHQVIATNQSQQTFIERHFGSGPTIPFLAPEKLP